MNITINTAVDAGSNALPDALRNRVTTTLSRFADRILRVNVTLVDVNGPRGGADKECRVSVGLPRHGQVTATARHENPLVAVSLAAERVRRIVVTKLKRPRALQVRRRRRPIASVALQTADTMEL